MNKLQFFEYRHLPEHLQEVSKLFSDLAWKMNKVLPLDSETNRAFDKLLEAKDCAVRSMLFKSENKQATLDFKIRKLIEEYGALDVVMTVNKVQKPVSFLDSNELI